MIIAFSFVWIGGGKGLCPLTPPETFLKKGFWTSKNFWGIYLQNF
jgi:hypothetical protein